MAFMPSIDHALLFYGELPVPEKVHHLSRPFVVLSLRSKIFGWYQRHGVHKVRVLLVTLWIPLPKDFEELVLVRVDYLLQEQFVDRVRVRQ